MKTLDTTVLQKALNQIEDYIPQGELININVSIA